MVSRNPGWPYSTVEKDLVPPHSVYVVLCWDLTQGFGHTRQDPSQLSWNSSLSAALLPKHTYFLSLCLLWLLCNYSEAKV